ncbi:hypothetical protein BH10PSE7_BH10PSE7_00730 [soil metagenome]
MGKTAKNVGKKPEAKQPAAKPNARRVVSKPAKPSHPPRAVAVAGNKERFTLHGFALSGPTYTVALMLSLCRYPYSYIHVNLREGAHKQPDYLVKNRFGQVPSLRDGQTFLSQSSAILEYLATSLDKFDGKTPTEKHRVREWMFWNWDRLASPIFRLRARVRGFRQFADEVKVMYEGEARNSLAVLDHELGRSEWLAGKKPTIADIACYGVIRYAHEAQIDISGFHRVVDWKRRFEALPGFATPEQLLPLESRLL